MTASRPWSKHEIIQHALVFVCLVVVYPLVLVKNFRNYDTDSFWQITLGRYILQTGHIPTHAVFSYLGNLPYISQEAGFQIIAGLFYNWMGWDGLRLIFVICLFFVIWGLYQLILLSRSDLGLDGFPIIGHLLVLVIVMFISQYYVFRPQMLSTPFVIWFVIFGRRFGANPRPKRMLPLVVISWIVANVHAGVWPILPVFFMVELIASIRSRRLNVWFFVTVVLMIAVALLNPGGWTNITYFFHITSHQAYALIQEWQPVNYLEFKPMLIVFLVFIASLVTTRSMSWFRLGFALCITALGVSTYKLWLYFALFVIYFVRLPNSPRQSLRKGSTLVIVALSLAITLAVGFYGRYPIPDGPNGFPVDEMNYILKHNAHPKVLAPYGVGGYIIFRGGYDFVDGRFDPFISKASTLTSYRGLTAVDEELDIFAGNMTVLTYEIKENRPDYIIVPIDTTKIPGVLYQEMTQHYGRPNYQGPYGYVWNLSKTASATS